MGNVTKFVIFIALYLLIIACFLASDIYWSVRKRLLRGRGWVPLDLFLRTNELEASDVEVVCKAGGLHIRMRATPQGRFIDGETATSILDGVNAIKQSRANATKDNVQKAGLAGVGAVVGAVAIAMTKKDRAKAEEDEKDQSDGDVRRPQKRMRRPRFKRYEDDDLYEEDDANDDIKNYTLMNRIRVSDETVIEIWEYMGRRYRIRNAKELEWQWTFRRLRDDIGRSTNYYDSFERVIEGLPITRNELDVLVASLMLNASVQGEIVIPKSEDNYHQPSDDFSNRHKRHRPKPTQVPKAAKRIDKSRLLTSHVPLSFPNFNDKPDQGIGARADSIPAENRDTHKVKDSSNPQKYLGSHEKD